MEERGEKIEQKARLAKLVDKIRGNRSVAEMVEATGLSRAYIYALLRGQYLPTADVLRRLADPNANPQNGVTLNDLLKAIGLNELVDYVPLDALNVDTTNLDMEEEQKKSRIVNYSEAMSEEQFQRHKLLMAMSKGYIYESLHKQGIQYEVTPKSNFYFMQPIELTLEVKEPRIKEREKTIEYWFEFITLRDESELSRSKIENQFKMRLFRLLWDAPCEGRRLFWVTDNELLYEQALRWKEAISYRGNLTLLYIDKEIGDVIDEVDIAHYSDNPEDWSKVNIKI